MPRFIRWDFDAGIAVEYERLGECSGCGMCCTDIIKYLKVGQDTEGPGPMGNRVAAHGIWSEYADGDERRFISLPTATGERKPCDHLKDGKCKIHMLKSMQMATLCLAWPIIPEHVALLDQCSYTFREINRWPILEGALRRKP